MAKRFAKGKANQYSFAVMHHAAWSCLKAAEELPKGQTYQYLAAMMFSAFAVEGYLNHVGEMKIPDWLAAHERKSPKLKLKLIAAELSIDTGRAPFQFFCELFEFRNNPAHPKTVSLPWADTDELPQDEWLKKVTLDNAKKYVGRANEIIDAINNHLGDDKTPYSPVELLGDGSRAG